MNNQTRVGQNAFQYRFIVRETIGVLISALVSGVFFNIVSFLHKNNAVSFSLGIFVVLFIFQLIAVFVATFIEFNNLVYIIEENAITLKKGIIYVETQTIPFQKIKKSLFQQSIFQNLFGVGNIILDQGEEESFIWNNIDNQTANTIMDAVAKKSNIQPVVFTNK